MKPTIITRAVVPYRRRPLHMFNFDMQKILLVCGIIATASFLTCFDKRSRANQAQAQYMSNQLGIMSDALYDIRHDISTLRDERSRIRDTIVIEKTTEKVIEKIVQKWRPEKDLKNYLNSLPAGDQAEKYAKFYIQRFAKVAITEQHKFGIPASITLAQGLLESNAGRSTLATKANNHFGIKCHNKSCKKGNRKFRAHCHMRKDDVWNDRFRTYPSAWESYRAHSKLITSGRYADLKKSCGKDYRKWAIGLKNRGYATDKEYAKTLIKIIKQYRLNELDS